jgi:two-component system, NarL family, invasion response regulator UvrY
MIKVAIVDDHAIVRKGLRDFLGEQMGIQVVGEAANGREAITLVREKEPDVLLLDVSMPEQSGVEVMGHLLARAPDMAIVVLSGFPEEHYAMTVMRKGALGYLSKECDPAEIVKAIHTVALGRRYITPAVAELLAQQLNRKDEPAHLLLSEREFQVFLRLAKGESVSDIAAGLSLSVKTISTYRTRTLEKMGLQSNSDLTYYAMKSGLIQ